MINQKENIDGSVKFGEVKNGEHFKFRGRLYTKVDPEELGGLINAISEECFSWIHPECFVERVKKTV